MVYGNDDGMETGEYGFVLCLSPDFYLQCSLICGDQGSVDMWKMDMTCVMGSANIADCSGIRC